GAAALLHLIVVKGSALMELSSIFEERQVDHFTVLRHQGKQSLTCTVVERWNCILDHTLKCGNGYRHGITRTVGIKHSQKESLEAQVSGSLGCKGIAEFKSTLKGVTTQQYDFEDSYEEKEQYEFTAPKCGKLRI